jgi:drug/metabolite transporter (DMT)-like permease
MTESRPFTGILLMLGAVLCFSSLDASSKYMAQTFPVPMLVWARYSIHFLLMLIILAPSMRLRLVTTGQPWKHIARGLTLVFTSCFGIAGFRHLPLAEATAFLFIAPLIVVLMARWFLHEKVTLGRWAAVIVGFAGALLIARPGGALFGHPGNGLIFLAIAACSYAVYQIQTRQLSTSENTLTLLFYTALVGTVAMTLTAPFYWGGPMPNTVQASQLCGMGALGAVGHWLFTRAFRYAPASTLSPFTYAQLIWATLIGWLFYDHLPDSLSIAGIAVIAASSMSIALSERFKRRSAPDTDTAR